MEKPIPSPAAPFIRELVPLATQLHHLLGHMEQFEAEGLSDPHAPPIPEVLAALLTRTLAPVARRQPAELGTAAAVLAEVARAIEDELVGLPVPPPSARGTAAS